MVLIEEVSGGTRRRCDASCYNATGEKCTCVCGGKNHGVGLQRALEQAQEMAMEVLEAGGDVSRFTGRVLFEANRPGLEFHWPFKIRELYASGRMPVRCASCRRILSLGALVLMYDGQYWHVSCFKHDRPDEAKKLGVR